MSFSRRGFALALAASAVGCNTTINDVKVRKPFYHDWPIVGVDKDDPPVPYPNPVKIAATWSPDTLVQSGHTPTRGFGGRIYFYDERSSAVPVEGTLVVHGFDDTATDVHDESATRRFEFTPEQFTRHFSQSDLGASYSVWVPWDAVGGPQRRISLVTSFQTTSGKFVQGEPATILLPGIADPISPHESETLFSAQYQKHRRALAAGDSSRNMSTTTIARGGKRPGDKPSVAGPSMRVMPASARLR